MKVHANAPLGPKGRLTMVSRVLEEQWSLAQAGRGRLAVSLAFGLLGRDELDRLGVTACVGDDHAVQRGV
jgi:hypothetical protein